MIPWIFLAVSLAGAAFTLSALLRTRNLWVFVVPYFFGAWLTGELALHHIAWQLLATLGFVALGAFQAWPGFLGLGISLASWAGLFLLHRRATQAAESFESALHEGLGEPYRERTERTKTPHLSKEAPVRLWARPFRMHHGDIERIRNIAYGDAGKRNLLDIYRGNGASGKRPILLQIHGGAWVIGQKDQQGLPLMYELAARGWLCVAPNYRLSPKATFPDHIVDVKRALAWIRENASEFGGDPSFVAVTGGSAGGHLSALAALSANDPEFQPGFEEIDTQVDACVPFYGIYDLLDRHGFRGRASMRPFIERTLMKCSPNEERERWERASPISRVHLDAPPFFVIHGTHDSLSFVEDAREFVRSLRKVSKSPVVYAEVPGAQHAFDTFHSLRSRHAINAIARFLECVRAGRLG